MALTSRAADEQHATMLRDAQAAFDKVQDARSPVLADASACVQTQAAMLSVALPGEESDLHYRKGFCQLAVASITRSAAAFSDAASELDRAGANMLAWIARRAGKLDDQAGWKLPDNCPHSCTPLISTANLWLGWMALESGDLDAAGAKFIAQPETGWYSYTSGMRAFRAGRYAEAVSRYREALADWSAQQKALNPPLEARLSPPVDIPQLLTALGGAQILAGDPAGAVASLNRALESSPNARAYFLRARAKELGGQFDAAMADYNLASRAAFAVATGLASGEAHLYRGILFYRRKDYTRAEDEFTSALNFDIPLDLRPDAAAWRHLSAVASGFCGASREYLEQTLSTVSPYFPKEEAESAAAACRAGLP